MKNLIVLFFGLISLVLSAQKVQFLDLPFFFDREFEISGLTGNEDYLFLAAERCAKIFVVKKENMNHVETIHLDIKAITGGIEIEGISMYKNYLLITDEKKGRLFSFNLKTKILKEIKTIGKDMSAFTWKYGMEGIAVDEDSKIVYVLRERNKKQQSEIHSFFISEKEDLLYLNYRNQTLIQHENENWRYSGLAIDKNKYRLLCLKSYHLRGQPELDKFEIDHIPLDVLMNSNWRSKKLRSLSAEVSFMRASFATNLEGIYSDTESVFITSDNGEGEKDCSQKSRKTIMMKVKLE